MADMHGRLDEADAEQINTQALVHDIEQNIWRETVWLQGNATDMQRNTTRMQQEMRDMEQMHQAELVHQSNRTNAIYLRQNKTNEAFRSVVSDILTLVRMKKEPAEVRTGRKRRRAADIKFMTPVRRAVRSSSPNPTPRNGYKHDTLVYMNIINELFACKQINKALLR